VKKLSADKNSSPPSHVKFDRASLTEWLLGTILEGEFRPKTTFVASGTARYELRYKGTDGEQPLALSLSVETKQAGTLVLRWTPESR
jgi:hypothetical protein